MPNHVRNIISVEGKDAEKVLAFMKGKETDFNFNNLFLIPEELVGTTSPARIKTKEEIADSGDGIPSMLLISL